MTHDKRQMLDHIYSRLCLHCGVEAERYNHKRKRFIAALGSYPDDLLCAAYQHISHHLSPARMASEQDFIAFMEPAFRLRQHDTCMEAL
ncbi:MAG: hypothetical protein SFX19_09070 [Alphaproteobacteria bacterium]|nr:hypothetical protein [Alphaproteobacteria bacterium]